MNCTTLLKARRSALQLFICGLALVISLGMGTTVSAATIIQYSQDGKLFYPLPVISEAMAATTYYDYSEHEGHPGFGLSKRTGTLALFRDTADGVLSLIFVSGGGMGDRGSGKISVLGLPSDTQLSLNDNGRYHLTSNPGTLTGRFYYRNTTDGFVLSGLEGKTFAAQLQLSGLHGLKALRLTEGDPNSGGAFQPLNLRRPIYLRATFTPDVGGGAPPSVGTLVPEPGGLGLLGLIAGALIRRPGRKASVIR